MPCAAYQPPDAERGVLYRVVEAHLDAFLDAAAHHSEDARLPMFVEQEFRDFLTCGVLAHGFARLRCGECLRYLLAWNHELCHAALEVYARALLAVRSDAVSATAAPAA